MNNKWFPFRDWMRTRFLLSLSELTERIASKIQLNDNKQQRRRAKRDRKNRVSERAGMRANDHGSRVLRRSINECICTRVPCNFMSFCPSACVCLRFFLIRSFIFSLELSCCDFTFHISRRERGAGKCWVRWMWDEQKRSRKNWVDQKDWRWWLAMNFELVWLYHTCVCVFRQILGSFISILSFLFSLLVIFCEFTEKKLVFSLFE